MKLLLDENLSPGLVSELVSTYPGSAHVGSLGLRGASDGAIWELARQEKYTIVSKDNDFRQLSFLYGGPPRIIWLSVGNAGTKTILHLLHGQRARIQAFDTDTEESLLILALTEDGT